MERIRNLVLIMYPDIRTTGGLPITRDISQDELLTGRFKHLVKLQLERLKRNDHSVIGLTYEDTDENSFSSLYPIELFDDLISVGTTYDGWKGSNHRDLLESVSNRVFPDKKAKVTIGGYHVMDCVSLMTQVLRKKGLVTDVNHLLTNELGSLLVAHGLRSMFGRSYSRDERLDDRLYWQLLKEKTELRVAKMI